MRQASGGLSPVLNTIIWPTTARLSKTEQTLHQCAGKENIPAKPTTPLIYQEQLLRAEELAHVQLVNPTISKLLPLRRLITHCDISIQHFPSNIYDLDDFIYLTSTKNPYLKP